MSFYEWGGLAGTLTLGGLGIVLIVRAVQDRSRAATAVAIPVLAGPAFPAQAPPTVPPPAASVSAGEDSFFAATSTTIVPEPTGAVPHAASHTPWSTRSIIMLVIGVFLVVAALVQGYLTYLAPGAKIQMPDQLLGLSRLDTDSALSQQLTTAGEQLTGTDGVDLQVAGYGDVDQFVVVLAGTVDAKYGNPEDFFAGLSHGLEASGQTYTFSDVDPGPKGGTMRCATAPAQQPVAICGWTGDGVVGTVVLTGPPAKDYAAAAQEVRQSVEH